MSMLGFDTQKPKSLYTVLSSLIKQKYLENFHNTSGLNEMKGGKPAMQQWFGC